MPLSTATGFARGSVSRGRSPAFGGASTTRGIEADARERPDRPRLRYAGGDTRCGATPGIDGAAFSPEDSSTTLRVDGNRPRDGPETSIQASARAWTTSEPVRNPSHRSLNAFVMAFQSNWRVAVSQKLRSGAGKKDAS